MKKRTKAITIDKIKYAVVILSMINILAITYTLGNFGAGYFTLSLALLAGILSFVSSWASDFIAKYTKGRASRKQYINAKHFFKAAMISLGIPSFLFSLAVMIFGSIIGKFLLKDTFIGVCLVVSAPVIFLWTISEIISGFYRGMGMLKTVKLFIIVRQIGIAGFSWICMNYFMKYGAKIATLLHNQGLTAVYGAIGALAGVCLGCLLGLLLLLVFWLLIHKELNEMYAQDTTKYPESIWDCIKIIMISGIFSGIQSFLLFASIFINFCLYVRICMKNVSSPEYMKIAGNYFGLILPVIFLVIFLFILVNLYNLKGLSAFFRNEDYMQIRERRMGTLLCICTYTLLTSLSLTVLAKPICELLKCDRNDQIISLFMCSSLLVFTYTFGFLEQKLYASMNEMLFPFIVVLGGFILQIIISLTLLKANQGMMGISIPFVILHFLIGSILFFGSIRKVRLYSGFLKKCMMLFIVAIASALLMLLIYQIGCKKISALTSIVICFVPGIIVYFSALTALRLIPSSETTRMPGGALIRLLNRLVHQE